MRIALAVSLFAALSAAPVSLRAQQAPAPDAVRVEGGQVMLIRDVRVPSEVEGVLRSVNVTEGQHVEAGDSLGTISDEQVELTIELKKAEEEEARLQAINDVNVRAAKKSAEYSAAEAKSYEELYEKRATPFWEMRRRQLDAERSGLAIELAEVEQQRAESTFAAKSAERKLAELEQRRRNITAPFAGQIAERISKPGEWVQPGTPILRLVALDRLRIEADIDASRLSRQALLGAPVTVTVHVTDQRREEFHGRINFVSPIMDAPTQSYVIWTEIENRTEAGDWLVIPGMRAELAIQPKTNVAGLATPAR